MPAPPVAFVEWIPAATRAPPSTAAATARRGSRHASGPHRAPARRALVGGVGVLAAVLFGSPADASAWRTVAASREATRLTAVLAADTRAAPDRHAADPAAAWRTARQLVLVTTADWSATTGALQRYARADDGDWRAVGTAVPVTIGRHGSAWGLGLHPAQPGPGKVEGDGRAPAGVFAIGTAFGYAPQASTGLAYAAMDAAHWCIDVPTSPLYNRIVDARAVGEAAVAGSTEPMRRDLHLNGDPVYRLGFVIEHNATRQAGAGSCIFAHQWRSPGSPTAGCTALAAADLDALLAWLDADAHPVFALLPAGELARVAARWALPVPSAR